MADFRSKKRPMAIVEEMSDFDREDEACCGVLRLRFPKTEEPSRGRRKKEKETAKKEKTEEKKEQRHVKK